MTAGSRPQCRSNHPPGNVPRQAGNRLTQGWPALLGQIVARLQNLQGRSLLVEANQRRRAHVPAHRIGVGHEPQGRTDGKAAHHDQLDLGRPDDGVPGAAGCAPIAVAVLVRGRRPVRVGQEEIGQLLEWVHGRVHEGSCTPGTTSTLFGSSYSLSCS
ncbi:MAG: hypothetical protein ACYTA3_13990 [Planctomycetota bacterium]